MEITKDFVVEQIKKQISNFKNNTNEEIVGTVIEIGDGIAKISGIDDAMMSEMLEFQTDKEKIYGVILNLEDGQVGSIVLGDYKKIKVGDSVKCTRKILSVPVGENIIGRVVDPLGKEIDGRGEIKEEAFYPVEKIAPGVIERESVNQPIQTGIKMIDSIIPIGKGQRELIIGDRQTGKTAISIDTIINQRGKNVKCIYVAIGQKKSKIATILEKLEKSGAMEYTTIVLASASDPASLLYIAPYSGCAMAEYFLDKGEDVLIVYDDLSKHAVAYREIALLLRRPPGREAYPGDVFYLHSRLLERSCKLSKEFGGGSITALPIIETQSSDVSAYIPTNVISITDGQIYLEPDLFNQGQRPAINAGLSVSRVGSSAQIKAMKRVSGKMKLDAAQYRELAAFAQFGSDLDEETKNKLERGKRLMEIFKQDQYSPVNLIHQIAIFFSLINGLLDNVDVKNIKNFESGLFNYIEINGKDIIKSIEQVGDLSDEVSEKLKEVIIDYKNLI